MKISFTEKIAQKRVNLAIRLSPALGKTFPGYFSKQLQNPIFILGSARSGTTVLADLLGTHKDVANWSEANRIWDPNWYPWKTSYYGKWPLEYDPESFITRWWNETEPRQKKIRAIFGAYQFLRGRRFFLNKSPFHTFRIPYLLKMFPGARFLHLVRDGRAVVSSYARRFVERNKLQEWPEPNRSLFSNSFQELAIWLARFWKDSIQEVELQDQKYQLRESGILTELRYEDLCRDPKGILDLVCRFLSLDPHRFSSMLRWERVKNQNHKWRLDLEQDTVNKITSQMESVLIKKGYLLESPVKL